MATTETTGAPKAGPVLSTLNEDGSRNWLKPRVSPGRFLTGRRIVAYALIAIFTLVPYLKMNGKPLILLNIIEREFTFFGVTFLPTDTLLLALLMLTVFVTIFLLTALLGRVWCGWACPQTVYMEFLYRPIERLFEGSPGKKQTLKGPTGLRKILKLVIYLLCSMFLAHTFLAYFVGVEQLFQWVQGSPLKHPTAFIVMAVVTGLMMFDFAFFREQLCLVACPYGRFQSVMLDRNSLIISYDERRGEPRGKKRRARPGQDVSLPVQQGDCIDCKLCVTTCPTGIDIRNGLQMECIGCAQCIDACDAVMRKIGRATGLIRYSSQSAMAGEKPKLIRPRVIIYPIFLAIVVGAFVGVLVTRAPADVTLLRGLGRPFAILADGTVANSIQVKIVNRTDQAATYSISTFGVDGALVLPPESRIIAVEPGAMETQPLQIVTPNTDFVNRRKQIGIRVSDGGSFEEDLSFSLMGPGGRRRADDSGGDAQ